MIPPAGFELQMNPLRHRVIYAFGLSAVGGSQNTAMATLVRHTNDIITTGAGVPKMIVVNPKNTNYVEDNGPAVCNMSILDKLSLSIKFNLTQEFDDDKMHMLKFLWRPIFFSFQEKLLAADDDTGTTVESILGLTSDTTFEDVVPITTNKLPIVGTSDKPQPVSTVNIAEIFSDYNMTTDTTMEDHAFVEDTFQSALRRFTNKGALKSMIGRTRHVTLSRQKDYMNFYIDKFVPRSIRRIQPFTFFGIQVHVPTIDEVEQEYHSTTMTSSVAHLGCKIICNFHEWNNGHYQNPEGVPPTSA